MCAANAFAERARLHWRRGQPIGLSGDEFTPPGCHAELLRGEQFALKISSRWFFSFFSFSPLFSPFLSFSFSPLLVPRLPFASVSSSFVVSSFYELQCLARETQLFSSEIETGSESEGSVNRGCEELRIITAIFVSRCIA